MYIWVKFMIYAKLLVKIAIIEHKISKQNYKNLAPLGNSTVENENIEFPVEFQMCLIE